MMERNPTPHCPSCIRVLWLNNFICHSMCYKEKNSEDNENLSAKCGACIFKRIKNIINHKMYFECPELPKFSEGGL